MIPGDILHELFRSLAALWDSHDRFCMQMWSLLGEKAQDFTWSFKSVQLYLREVFVERLSTGKE